MTGTKKRPLQRSPSSRFKKKVESQFILNHSPRSPYEKKFKKATIFSPQKRKFPKLFGAGDRVARNDSPLLNKGNLSEEVTFNSRRRLTKPSQDAECNESEYSDISTVTAEVSPLRLNLKRATECCSQSTTVTAEVSPLRLNLKRATDQSTTVTAEVSPLRLNLKNPPEYCSQSTTVTAIVSPLRLNLKGVTECSSQSTTVTAEVSPLRLNSKGITEYLSQKNSVLQESEVFLEDDIFSQSDLLNEADRSHDFISETDFLEEVNGDNNPYFPEQIVFYDDGSHRECSHLQPELVCSDETISDLAHHSNTIDNEIHNEQALIDAANTFNPIVLTSQDVPNADLPFYEVHRNTRKDLANWLKLRGVPQGGCGKDDLVNRVQACMDVGADKILDPSVEGGKWYEKKRNDAASLLQNSALFPETGWDPFPSRDIPQSYNFGSVYYYLVESMPQYQDPSMINSGEESVSEEEDEENVEVIELGDIFEDLDNKAVMSSKKIRRGLQFLKSGYVRGMKDCLPDRFHFFKGHIRASMEKKAYWVKAAISQISGNILRCESQVS
ncbi:Serine carboxypeptidase 1 [Frankliniella fusca]|uniref:Serine carboxypeptidase 1 n=1 Tax=Frankliniella fusca TaxID=407009 RepID=A0AAE1HBC9_9NEOP|nr:Serine carboxypeptidase 1 [Frankliniella fusca]